MTSLQIRKMTYAAILLALAILMPRVAGLIPDIGKTRHYNGPSHSSDGSYVRIDIACVHLTVVSVHDKEKAFITSHNHMTVFFVRTDTCDHRTHRV